MKHSDGKLFLHKLKTHSVTPFVDFNVKKPVQFHFYQMVHDELYLTYY